MISAFGIDHGEVLAKGGPKHKVFRYTAEGAQAFKHNADNLARHADTPPNWQPGRKKDTFSGSKYRPGSRFRKEKQTTFTGEFKHGVGGTHTVSTYGGGLTGKAKLYLAGGAAGTAGAGAGAGYGYKKKKGSR